MDSSGLLCNRFKKGSSILSGFKTARGSRVVLDPINHVLRVFERLQKHSWKKRVPGEFITMMLL